MNSSYAKKSAADMRAAQKETLEQAAAVQKTVAVMEPNWRALIASLTQMAETEAQIQEQLDRLQLLATRKELDAIMADVWNKLAVLVTRGELQGILNRQIRMLTEQQKQTTEVMKAYRQQILTAAEEAQQKIAHTTTSTEAHCGQLSEKFSKAISEQQSQMKQWMLRCLLISLIPSVLQLSLLLTQLI